MLNSLKSYCEGLVHSFNLIDKDRRILLGKIATYISNQQEKGLAVQLVYVCTHNSRRSHFGQVWSKVAAHYFRIENIFTYSGGTEATAFNAQAIASLERSGLTIERISKGKNPVYYVTYGEKEKPLICFSKVYDHIENPSIDFAAIMTCSDAEENCPFIPGVDLRIATTYDDPKQFDGTDLMQMKYDERCEQIARETFYVFSLVSEKGNRA
ncbi:MAG: protein-tyrosine-phosphatase [Flavobacteriales bacterium]|nr:protein-tyrosine-phosphatase [Flavobacteriales bacterium]